MKLVIGFCVFIALVYGKSSKPCRRSDRNIDACILNVIEKTRPSLRLEPFTVDRLYSDVSISGAKMQATLTNVAAYGGSKFQIQFLKVNRKQYTFDVQILIPELYIESYYYFKGNKFEYYSFFETYGIFQAKFFNIEVTFHCEASPYTKRGKKFLKLDSVTSKVLFGNGMLKLTPYDMTMMGHIIAAYARTDPKEAIQQMTPTIEKQAASHLKDFVNKLLSEKPLRYLIVD